METRAHYIVIGAFVLSVIAAAFLAILWLGQQQREFDEYEIIFTERVSGLSVGAQVRFNGIQKGEVESLVIDADDPSIVVAHIRVEKDTPVKTDTTAELEPVGFTGLLIVQLVGGSAEAELLKVASDERTPRIRADMSGFGSLLSGGGDIVAQAQQLLSDKNIDGVSAIIANIETLTGVVADNEEEIATTLDNVAQITADLAAATAKLEAAASSIETFFDSDAPRSLEEIDDLVNEAQALVTDLRGVVEENRGSLKIFADQGLGQIAPALSEGRRLLRTLDYMLREIDRDPQAYFLGERSPEYQPEAE